MCKAANSFFQLNREMQDPNVRQEMLDAYHAGDTHWRGARLIGPGEATQGNLPFFGKGQGSAIMLGQLPRSGASKQYVANGAGGRTYSSNAPTTPFAPGPNRVIS